MNLPSAQWLYELYQKSSFFYPAYHLRHNA